jgi:cob(I)alamin adenosyltransferase
MVVLNRIYTRTGDDGTTALGNGERRAKYDLRIGAYGTVDEANAAIGIVRLHLSEARDLDVMLGMISPLTSFVLPGGTLAAAYLHLARTICRRAERMMVELAAQPNEPVSDAAIQYINRLSDFLFVASRTANNNGAGDVLWVPGQNR